MKIRNKLTLLFILIVAFFLTLSSIAIYYFSSEFREDEFYGRLQNKAEGVAKLLLEVDEVDTDLLKIIEKNSPGSLPNEKILIFDRNNNELYSNDESDFLQVDAELLNQIRQKKILRFKQDDHEVLGILLLEKYDESVALAAATDIFGLSKLRFLRNILIAVFGVSIVAVFFAGRLYSGRALAPISDVVKQVENITVTSLNSRVNEGNGTDEIAILAKTFNQMLDRLEKAFNIQKNFIANASHELRTPLTAITGQLEISLMKDRTNEEMKETVSSVLDDIKNLNQTSNRLLLLAQASSDSQELNFAPVRIDDVIWQARTELMKIKKDYNILIFFDDELDDDTKLTIRGNEQLIKTTIINLMDNGCKYSSNEEVKVFIKPSGNNISLEFTDSGIGINPDDLNNIFQPFYRGKNAINIKGHGIGLSLVEKIVKLHQGDINVDSQLNVGTTFRMVFPSYR